jgi:amino acid adenylation domain-containing protein
MRSVLELIAQLRSLNAKLSIDGDNLHLVAPPNTITPELRQELASHKHEIIDFLRQATRPIAASPATISLKSRPDVLPLSFSQERLWFLYQVKPDSPVYNVPLVFCLRGGLNIPALERSIDLIIGRHEALRTVFPFKDGQVSQVVLPHETFHLPLIKHPGDWKDWILLESNRPFNLEHGPLFRTTLLKLADDEHILFINNHHIITDSWSDRVFFQELSQVYTAILNGHDPLIPPLPIQYADFAIWQRNWLQGDVLSSQLEYWHRQFRDIPEPIALPTDFPRPVIQTFRGKVQNFALDTGLLERAKSFSKQHDATLFMFLMAIFQVLLYRYSGQSEFAVGIPIANRTRTEFERLIGFFVNTLVLRANLSGDPTFEEILKRVREVSLEAYAHQDVPFEKLLADLNIKRDLGRNALFQVMFVLQNAPVAQLTLPGLSIEEIPVASEASKFDLTLVINETEKDTSIAVEYSTDLFTQETIERLVGHYLSLLAAVLSAPQEKISRMPLLTKAERDQILVEWNKTQVEYPLNKCVHELFEEQVKSSPETLAVIFGSQQITYQALNHSANQLAHHLRSLGVGPETVVGICLERSPEMVIACLAILKAGGAYLPIDSTYPRDRLEFIFTDANLKILLTQEKLLSKLPINGLTALCLDRDAGQFGNQSGQNLGIPVTPDTLAYIIYTSGSTGRPKGVMLTHRGIPNLCAALRKSFDVTKQNTRFLQFSSFSFDASVVEIFVTLSAGATIVMASQEQLYPGTPLQKTLQELEITNVILPPSVLAMLDEKDFPNLRTVISAGEACTPEILARWSRNRHFVNGYGPTEATVCATAAEYFSGGSERNQAVSIGHPIDNTQIYILDNHAQPVPVGILGEIYIGGAGLARGYLNRPELTQEFFIANPFVQDAEERLYKTGDLGRYLPDGNIEFHGRIDNQVKIRGFRIELGEIEDILRKHPAIQQTAVVVREVRPGDKQLVAYIISHNGHRPTSVELRNFLKEHLPVYMLPSSFSFLDTFPMTSSGKVDRNALPDPEWCPAEITVQESFSNDETWIANIWAEELKIPQVGLDNNFFELGGSSLMVAKIHIRLQARYNSAVSLVDIFEFPTVRSLTQHILVQTQPQPESSTETPDQSSDTSRGLRRLSQLRIENRRKSS